MITTDYHTRDCKLPPDQKLRRRGMSKADVLCIAEMEQRKFHTIPDYEVLLEDGTWTLSGYDVERESDVKFALSSSQMGYIFELVEME